MTDQTDNLRKPTLLLVDSDKQQADMAALWLKGEFKENLEIIWAPTPHAALALLAQGGVEVVITEEIGLLTFIAQNCPQVATIVFADLSQSNSSVDKFPETVPFVAKTNWPALRMAVTNALAGRPDRAA